MSYNHVKPHNPRQSKIWNYYNNSNSWDWYRISIWPENLARALIEEKLTGKIRWQMFLYFVGNGMDPKIAVREMLEMGKEYFDESAIRDVESLPESIGRSDGEYDYWDEILMKTVPLTRRSKQELIYGKMSKKSKVRFEEEEARKSREVGRMQLWMNDRETSNKFDEDEEISEYYVNPFLRKSKVIEQKGSVFSLNTRYALVHCIAEDAMMGAGIARTFRTKYPDMQRYIRSKRPKVGDIVIYEADDGRVIVNMVTKKSSWDKPTRVDFTEALITLCEWIDNKDIKYVGMPKIGAGLDRLDWKTTLDGLKTMLFYSSVTVVIREL